MDRVAFADAIVTFASYRKHALIDRLRKGNVHKLTNESCYRRSLERYATTERDALRNLEPDSALLYLAIVAKHCGESEAIKLANDLRRIASIDGVTIQLETSDYDPSQTTAHIHDELATEWCDYHGALDGGTWEECDGPEFCYDILQWYPGQIQALQKEGYHFDFSQYSEPSEEEIEILKHAATCIDCDCDYSKSEEHVLR